MTAYLNESANMSDFHIYLSRQRQDLSAKMNAEYNYDVTQH